MRERGVYAIVCRDGRQYVGGSVHIRQRWAYHRSHLRRGIHDNHRLQGAWFELGEEAFLFTVLELVPDGDLRAAEQKWLDHFRASEEGFNLHPTAGSPAGIVRSEKVRRAMSERQLGVRAGEGTSKKLKNADVIEMRALSKSGTRLLPLARRFGVSVSNVHMIVSRRTWRHID